MLLASRPLDLSKLIPKAEDGSPRSPGSPPVVHNPYQAWSTSSSEHTKKLRLRLAESPRKGEEDAYKLLKSTWTRTRVCDFEPYRLTRKMRHDMLKLVRTYHSYVMGLPEGAWELYDYTISLKYARIRKQDTIGVVTVFRGLESIVTIDVNGDHMYKILSLMIEQHA